MRTDMLQQLEGVVRRAGDIVREAHDIERATMEKHGAADLVTKYDVAVQGFLQRELLALLPEADFLGEEGDHTALTRPWTFIVDPIDGTTNFVRRLHYSDISVALAQDGQTQYAVVYDPFADELFWREGITSESEELICALIRNMALECYRQWVRAGKVVPMEEAAQILGSMTLHSVEHLMSPRPESD